HPSRLEFSAIRTNGVADDPHLHGRRIGFSRFTRVSNCQSKGEVLRTLPLVFLARRRDHRDERMQTSPRGWQAPKPNESRILRTLRCDIIHWRTDAPGVVS